MDSPSKSNRCNDTSFQSFLECALSRLLAHSLSDRSAGRTSLPTMRSPRLTSALLAGALATVVRVLDLAATAYSSMPRPAGATAAFVELETLRSTYREAIADIEARSPKR